VTRFAIVAALLALAGASGATADPPQGLRVLFLGNSLTASNDLPAEVGRLAAAAGLRIEYRAVVYAGFNLEDHWNLGDARSALGTGNFDVVVMQQGPSALPESQIDLELWAKRWADEARALGTRPALWTVWPESWRASALSDVIRSYGTAAKAAGAEIYPAGAGWLYAWQCRPTLSLYGRDGFHPSPLGTQAAALVVYGGLFKVPVRSSALGKPGNARKTDRLLQWAAAKALGRKLPASSSCGRQPSRSR
jgi:hypothetical protein